LRKGKGEHKDEFRRTTTIGTKITRDEKKRNVRFLIKRGFGGVKHAEKNDRKKVLDD